MSRQPIERGDDRTIEVYADWQGLGGPTRVGTLRVASARGREVFSFEYDSRWLGSGRAQGIDPALTLGGGPQYPSADRTNFGMFMDSSPDRWGRVLMDRRESAAARSEGRARRVLRESDYLLGVFDGSRMGALRFRVESNGPFVDDNRGAASPPWTSLAELEHACLSIERGGSEKESGYRQWLRVLVAPGSSLGGARPKATVADTGGALWVAKFPSARDRHDTGAWEHIVSQLARMAGIVVPESMARRFTGSRHTFLARRFDRAPGGARLHFASAMTLMSRQDGDDASAGASYLELAELLMRHGARTNDDLEQLWRRVVFSMCVSNCDDHLRNHGFILEPNGWRLSPAYDMNPDPQADGLSLNVSDSDNALDLGLAMEVADFYRVSAARAGEISDEVAATVRRWRSVARASHIPETEQDYMAPAFRVAEGA